MKKTSQIAKLVVAGLLIAACSDAPGATSVVMKPPQTSTAVDIFSIDEYHYSRDREKLTVEARGKAVSLGILEYVWRDDYLSIRYSRPSGERYAVETNLGHRFRSDIPPRFDITDLRSGDSASATWESSGGTDSDGSWVISGPGTTTEATSLLKDQAKGAVVFISTVSEDMFQNLSLRTAPVEGFENLITD